MLNNFFRVIFRYILRSKFFTAINVAGLSIGIACSIVIYLYIKHELSFDRFHEEGRSIYRVLRQSQINGMPYDIGVTSGPYKHALLTDFANQITEATRTLPGNGFVQAGGETFAEDYTLFADKNFFRFFSYPLAEGNPDEVLANPNNVVISKALALKYFGDGSPVGKTIRYENEYDLVVTGVLDELPANTHLQFDLVGSLEIVERETWFQNWWANSLYTYIKVQDENAVRFMNAGFPAFMDKYFGEDFRRIGNRIDLKLEPLSDIYFNNDVRYERNVAHGDRKYVVIFGSIGVLLIILAAINYTNLSTAQASRRAKEVGVRKTLGSARSAIAMQFIGESFVLCLASVVIALGMVQMILPSFESAFGIRLDGLFADPYLPLFLLGLLMVMTVLAGAYPAFLLSSMQPVEVMKGEVKGDWNYLFLRKALVVVQFSISVFMIIATLFIGQQLKYMRDKDLGFDQDQLLVVRVNNRVVGEQYKTFKERVLAETGVVDASFVTGYPGGFYDATTVNVEGREENIRMRTLWTDEDFSQTMGVDMVAGRSFSIEIPSDRYDAVMLNETAVRQLGWTAEEAIGNRVMIAQFDSTYKQVVGVVGDYHFTSLREKIEPLIISYGDDRRLGGSSMCVKLSGGEIHNAVATIEKIWNGFGSGFPCEWFFLDERVQQLYRNEGMQSRLFTIFSTISVVIAALGIFGLTSFLAVQRRKEIGVRKILGASSEQISVLLMKDMLLLVLLSNLVAIPAGYWAISRWLEGFAYRVPMQPVIFVYGAIIVFGIAMVIVGLRAAWSAMENPVNALRTEV